MTKVLVFGKTGQVGSSLLELTGEIAHTGKLPGGCRLEEWTFLGPEELDLSSPSALNSVLQELKPQVLINAAAYTAVDKAETERDLATAVNAQAVGVMARWCAANGASLVHYSTDYVYPGFGEKPWTEEDRTGPLNHYGQSKLEGEKQILESGCHHVILRTSWVFAASGSNFVLTMLRLGAERPELKVVNDQIGSPTSAMDLARATLHILQHPQFRERRIGGIYHLAGRGFTSWFGFAEQIFSRAKTLGLRLKLEKLTGIPSELYPTPAKRPMNSRLNQSKIERDFGWQSAPWQDALEEVLEEITVRNMR